MKFAIIQTYSATRYLGEIEADSEEEAIKKAYELNNFEIPATENCVDPFLVEVIAEVIK